MQSFCNAGGILGTPCMGYSKQLLLGSKGLRERISKNDFML